MIEDYHAEVALFLRIKFKSENLISAKPAKADGVDGSLPRRRNAP